MDWRHIDLIRERRRRRREEQPAGGGGEGHWGQPSQQPNKYINKYMKYVQKKTINPFTPIQRQREEKAASSSTHQSAPMDWMEGGEDCGGQK
jgi:hypothetical protein